MGAPAASSTATSPIRHTKEFRRRRFLNWFPMGLSYALLYMGRYNLTVAKNALGELMTKEDFGIIFGVGTLTYALAFLFNGPLVDRIGGRRGILTGVAIAAVANLVMGLYLRSLMASGEVTAAPLTLIFSALYAVNMYGQSFGAVSIVKVNAHWFHVTERGGFSGIFGTMISSGIFLAFTANAWFLDLADKVLGKSSPFVVFLTPAAFLTAIWLVEVFLLRDRPSQAGHEDFDTGDASSGDTSEEPVPTLQLLKQILTNPIILTVAGIEFCSGVLRNGVMHWFPIYAKEVWVLPDEHLLRYGSWEHLWVIGACFVVAAISGVFAARANTGRKRGVFVILAALAFLAPFVQGGWGGLLFVAGVLGGNVAGWVSDLFFQSRRGPAAGGMYAFMALCAVGMIFALSPSTAEVKDAEEASGLQPGDRIVAIAGEKEIDGWEDVRDAVACWKPVCVSSSWDADKCKCTGKEGGVSLAAAKEQTAEATIPATIERGGETIEAKLPDPKAAQRAGDKRILKAHPVLPLTPYVMGALVFFISMCVIGAHGLLSGTATMDFGGRKGAATAVGVIDGFVYAGTALQSITLGYLTTISWSYWPPFLVPFGIIGFLFCLRIWKAKPGQKK